MSGSMYILMEWCSYFVGGSCHICCQFFVGRAGSLSTILFDCCGDGECDTLCSTCLGGCLGDGGCVTFWDTSLDVCVIGVLHALVEGVLGLV